MSETLADGQTHHLSLYEAPSGARVFGAGTVQWSWGLDSVHDRGSGAASTDMQQATVNLFADMGVQPGTLQDDLQATAALADLDLPVSTITFPVGGETFEVGATVTVLGTASDTGGAGVALVEVSTDGGLTWQTANGLASWSFNYTPAATGAVTHPEPRHGRRVQPGDARRGRAGDHRSADLPLHRVERRHPAGHRQHRRHASRWSWA